MENDVIVHVTKEDLKGRYGSVRNCPVARGLKRAFPGADIHVGGYNFTVDKKTIQFKDISKKLEAVNYALISHTAKPFWFRIRKELL